jgi:SAM-dependent methyltransferase
MLRYAAAAATLKLFSLPGGPTAYRRLGNYLGARRRSGASLDAGSPYMARARRTLRLCQKHDLVDDGANIVEIGTGWVHWEATVLALFYDVTATLVDVWDNRQLRAYKRYFAEFDRQIDSLPVDRGRTKRAHDRVARLLDASSFEEVYELLRFRYVVDRAGTLAGLRPESFDLAVSCAVLEHVRREVLPEFVANVVRTLRPGGHSLHTIDFGDHLAYLDPRVHQKQYLVYSDAVWRALFENRVQYFNRVQKSEWLAAFENAGLELKLLEEASTSLAGLRIARRFAGYSKSELACTSIRVVHEKPATGQPKQGFTA